MNPSVVVCEACGGKMTVRSMTSAGVSWACPCARTTFTQLDGGKLEVLELPSEPLGLVTDEQLREATDDA